MVCQGCGTKMHLVQRSRRGQKVYLRYACPKAACQKELLVVSTEADAKAGNPSPA